MWVIFEPAWGAVGEEAKVSSVDNDPVGGDAVEGFVHCGSEKAVECASGYGCVCAKDAEEGGHIWVYHPRSFAHAGKGIVASGGGQDGQCAEEEFGEGVGCADGLGGGELLFCVMSPCCGGRRGFWGGF